MVNSDTSTITAGVDPSLRESKRTESVSSVDPNLAKAFNILGAVSQQPKTETPVAGPRKEIIKPNEGLLYQGVMELWETRESDPDILAEKMVELLDKHRDSYLAERSDNWDRQDRKFIDPIRLHELAYLLSDQPDNIRSKLDSALGGEGLKNKNCLPEDLMNVIVDVARDSQGRIENSKDYLNLIPVSETELQGDGDLAQRQQQKFDVPDDLIPFLRRGLIMVSGIAEIDSESFVIDIRRHGTSTFREHGFYGNSAPKIFERASLATLQIAQQTGLIGEPLFKEAAVALKEELLSIGSADIGEEERIKQLQEEYGYSVLFNNDLWKLESGKENLRYEFDYNLEGLQLRAKQINSLRQRKRFNPVSSIARSSLNNSDLAEPERRKERILRDVQADKRESEAHNRSLALAKKQYLADTRNQIELPLQEVTKELVYVESETIEKALIEMVGLFRDDPTLSPASKRFLIRQEGSLWPTGKRINPEDSEYQIDMEMIKRDPFLLSVLKYMGRTENTNEFIRDMRKFETSDLGFQNREFFLKYCANRILNRIGLEEEVSPFLLSGYDPHRSLEEEGELRIRIYESLFLLSRTQDNMGVVGINNRVVTLRDIGDSATTEDVQRTTDEIEVGESVTLDKHKEKNGHDIISPVFRERVSRLGERVLGNEKIRQLALASAGIFLVGSMIQGMGSAEFSRYVGNLASREAKTAGIRYVGDVINDNKYQDGDELGFLPTQYAVDGALGYVNSGLEIVTTDVDEISGLSNEGGLVLKRTINPGDKISSPMGRDLLSVQVLSGPSNAIYKVGLGGIGATAEVEVVQMLSETLPEKSSRVTQVETLSGEAYEINPNFEEARNLLKTLEPGSDLEMYYRSLVENIESSVGSGASSEEISKLIIEELNRFEKEFLGGRYYALNTDLDTPTFAEGLSKNIDQGYRCEVAVYLTEELFQPLGVNVGNISGESLEYANGGAWTKKDGHVNNLFVLPTGEVYMVNMTPAIVEGKTPKSDLSYLEASSPSNNADIANIDENGKPLTINGTNQRRNLSPSELGYIDTKVGEAKGIDYSKFAAIGSFGVFGVSKGLDMYLRYKRKSKSLVLNGDEGSGPEEENILNASISISPAENVAPEENVINNNNQQVSSVMPESDENRGVIENDVVIDDPDRLITDEVTILPDDGVSTESAEVGTSNLTEVNRVRCIDTIIELLTPLEGVIDENERKNIAVCTVYGILASTGSDLEEITQTTRHIGSNMQQAQRQLAVYVKNSMSGEDRSGSDQQKEEINPALLKLLRFYDTSAIGLLTADLRAAMSARDGSGTTPNRTMIKNFLSSDVVGWKI